MIVDTSLPLYISSVESGFTEENTFKLTALAGAEITTTDISIQDSDPAETFAASLLKFTTTFNYLTEERPDTILWNNLTDTVDGFPEINAGVTYTGPGLKALGLLYIWYELEGTVYKVAKATAKKADFGVDTHSNASVDWEVVGAPIAEDTQLPDTYTEIAVSQPNLFPRIPEAGIDTVSIPVKELTLSFYNSLVVRIDPPDAFYTSEFNIGIDVAAFLRSEHLKKLYRKRIIDDMNSYMPDSFSLSLRDVFSFTFPLITPQAPGLEEGNTLELNITGTVAKTNVEAPELPTLTLDYNETILDASPIAYWRFHETSGTTVVDEMGTYDGTLSNTDNLYDQAGPTENVPKSMYFSATTQLDMPINIGLIKQAGSIEFIIKPFGINLHDHARIFYWGLNGILGTPQTVLTISLDTDSTQYELVDANYEGHVFPGEWSHIVLTLETANTVSYYLNGQFVATVNLATPIPDAATLSISNASTFGGYLTEFAVYDYVLATEDIQAHYDATLLGSALIEQYPETTLVASFFTGGTNFDNGIKGVSGDTYDAVIDWGDGTPTAAITSYDDPDLLHTFPAADRLYQATITGTFGGFTFYDAASQYGYEVIGLENVKLPENSYYACYNMDALASTKNIDCTNVTDFQRAFSACNYLNKLDLRNTGNITNWLDAFSTNRFVVFPENLDFTSAVNAQGVFFGSIYLVEVPDLIFGPNCTSAQQLFDESISLKTVGNITFNLASGTLNLTFLLDGTTALETAGTITALTSGTIDCGYLARNSGITTPIDVVAPNSTDLVYFYSFSGSSITNVTGLTGSNKISSLRGAFANCKSLTTITTTDFSNCTNFNNAFEYCTALTSIPELQFSDSKTFSFLYVFQGCTALTSIPALNFSMATDLSYSFRYCSNLATVPALEIRSGTIVTDMFYACRSLSSFGGFTVGTPFRVMFTWAYCSSLPSFDSGLVDFSNCISIEGAWAGCSSMTSFGETDFPTADYADYAWAGCRSLTSFPAINIPLESYFTGTWTGCTSLTAFPLITYDFDGNIKFEGAWAGCTSLTTFPAGFFSTQSTFFGETNPFGYAWQDCNLSAQSIENILTNIDSIPIDNYPDWFIQSIYLSGNSTLTTAAENAKTSLEGKGWTVILNADTSSTVTITTKTIYSGNTFGFQILPHIGEYDAVVDWGDGTTTTITTDTLFDNRDLSVGSTTEMVISHVYSTTGSKTITITGKLPSFDEYGNDITTIDGGKFLYLKLNQYSDFTATNIDTSNQVDFSSAFESQLLDTLPTGLDTSNGYNFNAVFKTSDITTVPSSLDFSKGRNFGSAWYNCNILTTFEPTLFSEARSFFQTWYRCFELASFPTISAPKVTNLERAWADCTSLTTFPALTLPKANYFIRTWENCNSLVSFPLITFDTTVSVGFYRAWAGCTSLTTFPANFFDSCTEFNTNAFDGAWSNCKLNAQSIENILVSIDTAPAPGRTTYNDIDIHGDPTLTTAAQAAKTSLEAKGWDVFIVANGY